MTELLFLPWRYLSRGERVGLLVLLATIGIWLLLPRISAANLGCNFVVYEISASRLDFSVRRL